MFLKTAKAPAPLKVQLAKLFFKKDFEKCALFWNNSRGSCSKKYTNIHVNLIDNLQKFYFFHLLDLQPSEA